MSEPEQLSLDLAARQRRALLDSRLAQLISVLRVCGGHEWMTARQLRERGFADRELRELVEHDDAGDVLSFPGSPGYKLFERAELAEIERAGALKNQARRMLRRHLRYVRRRHRGRIAA